VSVTVTDSFVLSEWADGGSHPGRPIAGLRSGERSDRAQIFAEHDSEVLV